jgi:hypothetical protein
MRLSTNWIDGSLPPRKDGRPRNLTDCNPAAAVVIRAAVLRRHDILLAGVGGGKFGGQCNRVRGGLLQERVKGGLPLGI